MFIGEKVHFKRKELGITQEKLCREICSITYLSKLENNKIEAKEDILKMLCKRLDISIEYLIKNEE